MLLAADWGVGEVLWALVWFFLFFVWVMLIFTIFADIVRNDDLSGGAKAVWAVFIIFLPFLGVFVYLVANGAEMGERHRRAREHHAAGQHPTPASAGNGTNHAEQLATLAELHNGGKLDDAEYAAAKAKIINS